MSHNDRSAARSSGPRRRRGRLAGFVFAVGVSAAVAAGCEVSNPGRVQDESIALPGAQEALVNGAGRMMVEAVNDLGYTGALVSREIFPGGQTGAHGHDVLVQGGYIEPGSFDGHFNEAQQARYIAEEALRRFGEEGVETTPDLLFQAYNWAGYANRVLGEHWCEAVFDGQALEPGLAYFQRAEEHFTAALDAAPDENARLTALAGRAQVRVWLQDWDGAVADAGAIPDDFVFALNMDNAEADTRNMIYWANANQPYRAYTIRYTNYEDYYANTGDPRTAWVDDADPDNDYANASLAGFGQVEWTNQLKYTSANDDIRLASGDEMRLIEAEAILAQNGPFSDAMDLINGVRTKENSDVTGDPLEPWTASSPAEAWTALKQERAIELWLEARRFGDLRRWEVNETPGDDWVPRWEDVEEFGIFREHERSRCFDVPDNERDANPNVPPSEVG